MSGFSRRLGVAGAVTAGLAVGLGGGVWAGTTLLRPPPDVLQAPEFALVEARSGTVGRVLRLNTSARWAATQRADGAAAGVVTGLVLEENTRAEPGAVLYTVDLRPVVVAEGAVPSFRDLSRGAVGEDVAQLQRLLITLGYYIGDATGTFTSGTEWAVRAWQTDMGVEKDGTVRRGDVVYVPKLPARLALDPDLTVGKEVGSGYPAVRVLPSAPRFTIPLAENQVTIVEPGAKVAMTFEGVTWHAVVKGIETPSGTGPAPDVPQNPVAVLEAAGEGAVCGDECGRVPLGEATLIDSEIEVVPEADGVTVPAAAVVTTASGQTGVTLASGEFREIDVVASASGMAVVEGLDVGEQVRTPGQAP